MNKKLKFRAWAGNNEMLYDVCPVNNNSVITDMQGFPPCSSVLYRHDIKAIMQFTGMKDANDKEIYEGDFFRTNEDTPYIHQENYVIVTWIQEWTMFASLILSLIHI